MKPFTIQEFTHSATAQRLGIANVPPPAAEAALRRLVEQVLDPLREVWGRPIKVTSGYRCPELNKAVGGVPQSQHMAGEAADVTAGSPQLNAQLWSLLQQLNLPIDQAINERGYAWLHLSCGPRDRRRYFAAP